MSSAFERLQKLAEEKKKSEKPKLEVVPKTEVSGTVPSSPSTPTTTSTTPSTLTTPGSPSTLSNNSDISKENLEVITGTARQKKQPVSPERDFQKVSNSIVREAIPGGLFKSGKCKQLYDALYSLTRGAIKPQRTVRINKPRLMKLSGIGTRETLWQNLKHLEVVGLLEINVLNGEHGGNEYTVNLPEELAPTGDSPSSPSTTSKPVYSYQNPPVVPVVESTSGSPGSSLMNTGDSEGSKTSLKTLKYIDDDAPIISLLEKFNEMARKVTGKDLTKKDLEKMSDLADILITETVLAAARTGSVSAAVPFMTENLRRRLYSKPRSTAAKKETRPKHLDIGKGSEDKNEDGDKWTPQTPLTDDQRRNTLNALKEAKETDTVLFREFKVYGEIEYTPEDFDWLSKELSFDK